MTSRRKCKRKNKKLKGLSDKHLKFSLIFIKLQKILKLIQENNICSSFSTPAFYSINFQKKNVGSLKFNGFIIANYNIFETLYYVSLQLIIVSSKDILLR